MTVETTYFCDRCERIIEGAKVAVQITVSDPGDPVPGAPSLVQNSRYETRTVHFHDKCAGDLLQEIQDTVVDTIKVSMP